MMNDEATQSAYFIGELTTKLLHAAALLAICNELWDNQARVHSLTQFERLQLNNLAEKSVLEAKMRERAEMSQQRQTEWLRYMLHEIRGPLNIAALAVESLQTTHSFPCSSGFSSSPVELNEGALLVQLPEAPAQLEHATTRTFSSSSSVDSYRLSSSPASPALAEECRTSLKDMHNAVFLMSRLLTDMMSLQRLEDGELAIHLCPFRWRSLIDTLARMFVAKAMTNGLNLVFDVEDGLPTVEGDQDRILQVLINLVDNALHFTPRGGSVTVSITTQHQPTASLLSFVVSVQDTGIGISSSDLPRLFVPYVHVASGEMMKGKKTGLGLSISSKLVSLMNGRLGVRTHVEQGSEFIMELDLPRSTTEPLHSTQDGSFPPVLVQSTSPPSVASATITSAASQDAITWADHAASTTESTGSPLCFLVVDDSTPTRKLLIRVLTRALSARCDEACDGREAVEMVRGDIQHYDAIFCDKEMPVMDGYEAVRAMRKLGVQCPIIGITANAVLVDQQQFCDCGLNGLITKPVETTKLLHMISGMLQSRRGGL